MKPHPAVFAAAAVALVGAMPAGAQHSDKACALLTAKEVSAAIGANVAAGRESSFPIDSGPSKGETMHMCRWMRGPMAGVSLNFLRQPTGAQRAAGEAAVRGQLDDLKKQGWTEKIEDSGDPKCAILTPPAMMKQAPAVTSCMTAANGSTIGIGYMSTSGTVSTAKVKALLAEAVARLK